MNPLKTQVGGSHLSANDTERLFCLALVNTLSTLDINRVTSRFLELRDNSVEVLQALKKETATYYVDPSSLPQTKLAEELQKLPKPHNPANLPSPGEGYRFLDEDEIKDGLCPEGTYRTAKSREELAKLREERK